MPNISVQHLYNDYRLAKEYPADYTLDFFSKNAILFNNFSAFKDGEELVLFVQLAWQHLNALYSKGRFNDTADNAVKYLQIIDNEIERLNVSNTKDKWYFGIIRLKGMAFHQLQEYKISYSVFKLLTEHDPENEDYRKWFNYSKYAKKMWISKTIYFSCFALFLVQIFFKKYIPSFMVRMSLDGIALLGIFGTLLYESYAKRSIRRKKDD